MALPFQINQYESNWQENPVILPQADGGFLVLWESYLNEYDDGPTATYVAGRYFDAAGNPTSDEIVVAGADGTMSGSPEMVQLPDGGMVITWVYDDYDDILTIDTEVHAVVLNADGSVRMGEFRVDTIPSNNAVRPIVTVTGDGGFVISYGADRSTTNFDQVFACAYTAAGVAKGPNFLLNRNIQDFDQLVTRGATMEDGRAVIIWTSEATIDNGGGGQNDIRATILNPDGSVFRADFRLAPSKGSAGYSNNYGYDVTALADGGFLMIHQRWAFDYHDDFDADGTCFVFAFYDRNGNARTAELLAHETDEVLNDVRVTQLATGEIVVVWTQQSETVGDIGDDAYGRVFSASGQPLGPIFEIGVDLDRYTEQSAIEVEALVGGGFVVAHMDEGIDSDDDGIAGRVYGRGTDGADQVTVDASGSMAGLGGNDRLTGNARANRLDGGAGQDALIDTAGGNDSLTGGTGNDTLQGGRGNDLLDGGAGQDLAVFTTTQAVTVDLARTTAQVTGEGSDMLLRIEHVSSGAGADALSGNAAANRLTGNGGNDQLSGRGGNDTLEGGAGRDLLLGGAGNDLLSGGGGADRFLFAPASGSDRITDFQLDSDVIRIDVANPNAPGVTISATAGGTLIAWGTSTVLLTGINPGQLDADDLIFI